MMPFLFFIGNSCTGLVNPLLLFLDGHLLPYTGKKHVHYAYNTQRRMPVPGRTNMVSTDITGRVVDFEIQEGKGNLRNHLIQLGTKWSPEIPEKPVMVFDREGYDANFFYTMTQKEIGFVTWQKHIDPKEFDVVTEDQFKEEFKLNGKVYRVFEGQKTFRYTLEKGEEKDFTLRKIYIWNVTSNRKTCALSNTKLQEMSTIDCAKAILNRWGASENTFKHLADRHPLHYQPGFKFVKSQKQEIANPEIKEKKRLQTTLKKNLSKLYKKFSKLKDVSNQDGSPRKNSTRERLKHEIQDQEAKIKQLREEFKRLPEKIDVSKLDDYKCYEKICDESKNLFDLVTSAVWNARKLMAEWLLPLYENNADEYIDLFYVITTCQGWIKSEKNKVTVRIEPLEQPRRRVAQVQFCRKLNSLKAKAPNGKLLMIEVGTAPI